MFAKEIWSLAIVGKMMCAVTNLGWGGALLSARSAFVRRVYIGSIRTATNVLPKMTVQQMVETRISFSPLGRDQIICVLQGSCCAQKERIRQRR
jgi:hypothetical protein